MKEDLSAEYVEEEIIRMKDMDKKKDIIGLTARDLMIIERSLRLLSNFDYQQYVPSLDLSLPSGISGRLVRKPNIGYVFAVDISSII